MVIDQAQQVKNEFEGRKATEVFKQLGAPIKTIKNLMLEYDEQIVRIQALLQKKKFLKSNDHKKDSLALFVPVSEILQEIIDQIKNDIFELEMSLKSRRNLLKSLNERVDQLMELANPQD